MGGTPLGADSLLDWSMRIGTKDADVAANPACSLVFGAAGVQFPPVLRNNGSFRGHYQDLLERVSSRRIIFCLNPLRQNSFSRKVSHAREVSCRGAVNVWQPRGGGQVDSGKVVTPTI